MQLFQHYIDGEFSNGTFQFESIDPATGKPWAIMPEARETEVNCAVSAARRAFTQGQWPKLTATQRGKLLYKLADWVEENAGYLAELETRDTGKIIRETASQIAYVADYYRYYAGCADKLEGAVLPIDKADMQVWTKPQAVGVVAAIIPWNSQLFLSAVKIGPALAAGCTLVIKASEDGPAPLLELAKGFHAVGFPLGVVNIITGFGKTCGSVLTSHPDIDHIAFTGGPITAKQVITNSANNLASLSLELGGKSPFIVFDDADLESAVNAQVAAIFAASGQSCVAGSRLLVQSSIKDEFINQLKQKAEAIKIGSPLDKSTEMGPLCTLRQRTHIEQIVNTSVAAGAKLISGGYAVNKEGFYYQPTIMDCDNAEQAPCLTTELFGPVLSVQSFTDEADALAKAGNSRYGLACGVFTQNLARAHRISAKIRTGIVWLNTYRAVSPIAPFGGFGLSGHGREGGMAAVMDYTRSKTVWLNTSDAPFPDPFVMR